MKLKHIYKDFLSLPYDEQVLFIRRYRTQRSEDLDADPIKKGRKKAAPSTKREPAIKTTPEERELLKKLGISMSQLKALKNLEE